MHKIRKLARFSFGRRPVTEFEVHFCSCGRWVAARIKIDGAADRLIAFSSMPPIENWLNTKATLETLPK